MIDLFSFANEDGAMASFYVVYHSGFGHTKCQVGAVRGGTASVSGLKAFIWMTDRTTSLLDALEHADAIILGCPTY